LVINRKPKILLPYILNIFLVTTTEGTTIHSIDNARKCWTACQWAQKSKTSFCTSFFKKLFSSIFLQQ